VLKMGCAGKKSGLVSSVVRVNYDIYIVTRAFMSNGLVALLYWAITEAETAAAKEAAIVGSPWCASNVVLG
jgi:hypothetical protein